MKYLFPNTTLIGKEEGKFCGIVCDILGIFFVNASGIPTELRHLRTFVIPNA